MLCDLVNLLPELANWITIFLILLTLLEMVKQRRATYKPDIVVFPISRFAYIGDSGFPDIWLDNRVEKIEDEDLTSQRSFFQLPIYNLGLGAARDVECKWSFDLEEFIGNVNEIKNYSPIKFEISIDENNFLFVDFPPKIKSYTNIASDINIDFILPSSIEKEETNILFPSTYIRLVQLYTLCEISHSISDGLDFPKFQFPELELSIKFKDIGGSRHSKKFKFNFSIGMMSIRKDPKNKSKFVNYSLGDFVFQGCVNRT